MADKILNMKLDCNGMYTLYMHTYTHYLDINIYIYTYTFTEIVYLCGNFYSNLHRLDCWMTPSLVPYLERA